jgi:hypothetical protein
VSLDESWRFRLEDALDRFNESGSARTVAGLTRTLGAPRVSVGTAAGSATRVRITVAWELTWYQWAVDVDGAEPAVSELANGRELSELDVAARHWNGRLAEGKILL